MKNSVFEQDICKTAETFDFSGLDNKKVLVTGATGLVCSAVVDMLLVCGAKVYAAGRSKEKVEQRFNQKAEFVQYDATKPLQFDENVDYIIHGASNATPSAYVTEPVATMMANIVGIGNLFEFAKTHQVEKVVYISSSEVYGKKEKITPFQEDDYGYVDLLNARSSYPMGKRAAETLCACYGEQYDLPFSIVRLGHIYGPTASPMDSRVSSAFALQAAQGKPIVMKSKGSQLRSYCYCVDCAAAILTVMLRGARGQAYNISHKDSVITIHQMAQIIAQAAQVPLRMELPTREEMTTFNPMDNSSLDSQKLEALGWRGLFQAEIGFLHTIQTIQGK